MTKRTDLFHSLAGLTTESQNKASRSIDSKSVPEILTIINNEDAKVSRAVRREKPYIALAVQLVIKAFWAGGRLVYVGAGTSGRLGILDASECPPTFGVDPGMVVACIAGGKRAVFRSQEGAEDRENDGKKDMQRMKISPKDVVCGIAASMRTPYVLRALQEAKRRGAKTIFITTNPRSQLNKRPFTKIKRMVNVAICPVVGPEVIMGSTRMKSGTAQKLVLNMITTASMIRIGKVYGNMMVDLRMNSRKLEERAKKVLMITTGVDYKKASRFLKHADGHVKTAIIMIKKNISADEARVKLKKANGFVRKALQM